MQAMPSTIPLSRTQPFTSSVMSVTVRPPVVRKLRSCWKTFIGRELYACPPLSTGSRRWLPSGAQRRVVHRGKPGEREGADHQPEVAHGDVVPLLVAHEVDDDPPEPRGDEI